jgi:hypothetical protein
VTSLGENAAKAAFGVFALSIALSGCASTYQPPRTPPPAQWTGVSGLENVGAPKALPGLKHAGDAFAAANVRFLRTGVLAETVETKTAFGGTMTLPKGSKAFATNYTLYVSANYGPSKNAQPTNDPIEWCVITPNGFDGKKAGSETACIFWEGPERSRYMQDYVVGGFAFAPYVDIGDAAGMPGPTPVFIEQPVDFGVPLTRELRILKVDAKTVRIGVVLSDGNKSRIMDQRSVRLPPGGEAVLGSAFRFRRGADPTAVEVSVIGSPEQAAAILDPQSRRSALESSNP